MCHHICRHDDYPYYNGVGPAERCRYSHTGSINSVVPPLACPPPRLKTVLVGHPNRHVPRHSTASAAPSTTSHSAPLVTSSRTTIPMTLSCCGMSADVFTMETGTQPSNWMAFCPVGPDAGSRWGRGEGGRLDVTASGVCAEARGPGAVFFCTTRGDQQSGVPDRRVWS